MEGNMKSSGRGIKGKVVYAGKTQTKSALNVTTRTYQQPKYPSSIDAMATAAYAAGSNDINNRAAAGGNNIAAGDNDIHKMAEEYIKSVRERIKNQQKVVMMYSKYAGKTQTKSAPSVTTHTKYPSSIDAMATAAYAAGGNDINKRAAAGGYDINKRAPAGGNDINERAPAGGNDINQMAAKYIQSVRERIKNEQ